MQTSPNSLRAKAMINMPLKASNLPTPRDEAWKWTDVSRSVTDALRGAETAAPAQIFVPEGVSVTRIEAKPAANDTTLLKLATEYAGQIWAIEVPAGFSSEQPIQIEGLTQGHAQISINLGKGCLLYTSPSPRDQRGSRMPSSA